MTTAAQSNLILIADDAEVNRAILQELFCREFDIAEAENGEKAIRIIEAEHDRLAAVLLDVKMPVLDGFAVLKYLADKGDSNRIPIFLIIAENSSDLDAAMQIYENGVVDVIVKPIVAPTVVRKRVQNAIELYQSRRCLTDIVERQVASIRQQAEKLKNTNTSIIDMLSSVMEFRSGESSQHVRRIRKITQLLLTALSERYEEYRMSADLIETIANASAMHDIGKISIPDYILNKPGRLTPEEFAEMKKHPLYGCELFEKIPFFQKEEIFPYSYEICRHHHERWDGQGYPDGIKGDEIPICSQVVSIADVYDALVSERVYKKALPHEKAMSMIQNGECGAFNPRVLKEMAALEPAIYHDLYIGGEMSREERQSHLERASRLSRPAETQVISDRTLQLLEKERRRFNMLAQMSGDIYFDYDLQSDTMEFTEKYQEVFGGSLQIPHAAEYYAHCSQLQPGDYARIRDAILSLTPENPVCRTQLRMTTRSGNPEWFEIYIQAMWDTEREGQMISCLGKLTSIHQLKEESLHWKNQATHDYLTGLYNRQAFEMAVQQLLYSEPGKPFSLMFIDVDNFKKVNDTMGHQVGDRLLRKVAKTLPTILRSTDIFARIGGDEFAVLLSGTGDREVLRRKAASICEAFGRVIEPDFQCGISSSIGIAVYPDDGSDYKELLQKADTALYDVKGRGRGDFAFYHESMGRISDHTSLSDVESSE